MRVVAGAKHGKRGSGPQVERSSGNVFEDLGLPDAAGLLVKAELVSRISNIIARRRLTQAQAARVLGVDQPRITALLRGRLGGFSTEGLFRFLNALGSDIEIVLKPRRRSRTRPGVRVLK